MSEYRMPPPAEPGGYANYPRPGEMMPGGGPGSEFYRPPGVYFEAISDAWTLIKRDMGAWIGVVIVIYVASYVVSLPFTIIGSIVQNGGQFLPKPGAGPEITGNMIAGLSIQMLGNILAVPLYIAGPWVALQQIRYGRVEISQIFVPFRRFLALFGTYFVMAILISIGFLCLVVPSIYVLGATAFAMLLVVDKGVKPMEALSLSRQTVGKDAWALGGFIIVAAIVSILGACAFCIGVLFTMPLYYIGVALHYNYYFPPLAQSAATVDYSTPA